MNDADTPSGRPAVYALRLQERAIRDINITFVHLAETVDLDIAKQWRAGVRGAIAGLSSNPRRYPLVKEKFKNEVRHILYRRPKSKAAYRIVFAITGEAVASPDAPTVSILHVRHASARPITRKEARQIETEL